MRGSRCLVDAIGAAPGLTSRAPIIRSMPRASTLLVVIAVLLVCVWPPANDRSVAVKLLNWAADPADELPVLPPPFALGSGDDPDAVAAHDAQVQAYDIRYAQGGWMRRRLEWKVAGDPFNPATERQVILALAIVTAFAFWRVTRQANS